MNILHLSSTMVRDKQTMQTVDSLVICFADTQTFTNVKRTTFRYFLYASNICTR